MQNEVKHTWTRSLENPAVCISNCGQQSLYKIVHKPINIVEYFKHRNTCFKCEINCGIISILYEDSNKEWS